METTNAVLFENINDEVFETFNPDEELWLIGGMKVKSASGCGSSGGGDADVDFG